MTYIDQSVDTAILDHSPGIFGRGDVGFAIEGNVAKRVPIDKSHDPFNDA